MARQAGECQAVLSAGSRVPLQEASWRRTGMAIADWLA